MNCNNNITKKLGLLSVFCLMICAQSLFSQEEVATQNSTSSNTAYHNQLYFNRFLINPTFSLVRENKSYLNVLHRNQYATFEDNKQNYYIGYSNKLSERTALGLSVYGQWNGVMQEVGFNANYATAVQLGAKTRLTFGTNITYSNSGIDRERIVATENDETLQSTHKETQVAIQPAVTLSFGRFDVGVYGEELFGYNQTTNAFNTNLSLYSLKASLQYTHTFNAPRGLFENARLMPLVQVGQNEDNSISYVGSVLLDMPNYGWLQTTYDDMYGLSFGLGFNLNEKISIGYLLEKDVAEKEANLGWNHEISVAYTFKDNHAGQKGYSSESEDGRIDQIVKNYEEQILELKKEANSLKNKNNKNSETTAVADNTTTTTTSAEAAALENSMAYQNRLILDELILRQDSLETARAEDLEKRFELMIRVLKNEIAQEREKGNTTPTPAKKNIVINNALTGVAANDTKKEAKPSYSREDFNELPIKVLRQADIVGVKSGYYVIANVYKTEKYLNAFMADLKKQGLNAKTFYNKESGLHYVYLAASDLKEDLETAIASNLGGKYNKEKWIMQIDNGTYNPNTATVNNHYED